MTEEQINKSISTNYLTLGFWHWLNHYMIVGFFLLGTLTSLFLILTELINISPGTGELSFLFLIIFSSTCLVLTLLLGYLQRKRLKLELIPTLKDPYVLADQLRKLCADYEWRITHFDDLSIRIVTSMNLISWGEQIMLLFGENGVYLNCIATPDARATLFTFGRRTENTELVRKVINSDL